MVKASCVAVVSQVLAVAKFAVKGFPREWILVSSVYQRCVKLN